MPLYVASIFANAASEEVIDRVNFTADDDDDAKKEANRLLTDDRPKLRLDAEADGELRFVTFAALLPRG